MLGRFAEFILFGVTPLIVGTLMMPMALSAAEKHILGEVSYRERIALPPDAVLTVVLAELSLSGAPASIVAERRIERAGQVPIRFDLSFDPAALRANVSYVLLAHITVDNVLWFSNDERHAVDPESAEPQKILLKRAGTQEPAQN